MWYCEAVYEQKLRINSDSACTSWSIQIQGFCGLHGGERSTIATQTPAHVTGKILIRGHLTDWVHDDGERRLPYS